MIGRATPLTSGNDSLNTNYAPTNDDALSVPIGTDVAPGHWAHRGGSPSEARGGFVYLRNNGNGTANAVAYR